MNKLEKEFKAELERRATANSNTDFDKWGDRAIILVIIALPAYLIIRTLMTG